MFLFLITLTTYCVCRYNTSFAVPKHTQRLRSMVETGRVREERLLDEGRRVGQSAQPIHTLLAQLRTIVQLVWQDIERRERASGEAR
jgi:hypothetical protein